MGSIALELELLDMRRSSACSLQTTRQYGQDLLCSVGLLAAQAPASRRQTVDRAHEQMHASEVSRRRNTMDCLMDQDKGGPETNYWQIPDWVLFVWYIGEMLLLHRHLRSCGNARAFDRGDSLQSGVPVKMFVVPRLV